LNRVVQEIYDNATEFVRTFGAFQLFFLRLLRHSPSLLFFRFDVVVKQVYNAGAMSLVIVMICGLFVGAVLALQAYSNMSRFNAEDWTGVAAAFALVKELGPVMTAILFAGRAPVKRVLVPRFLGGVISMPLLAAIFSAVGMFGAHVVGVELFQVDVGSFWQQIQLTVEMSDIREGIIKSVVFGFAASLIAVWEGYNAIPTAEGVGRATTRTVVITAITILVFDFMITAALI
jgi:phospholipid/cholesterol/gamma-HCH transport system permease protein